MSRKIGSPKNFNPRPREEGDSTFVYCISQLRYFNPRPREEGDIFIVTAMPPQYNFNPRPREEGDSAVQKALNHDNISIHALVKRATLARF